MLEKQMWMIYARELYLEWKQSRDEGKEVEDLKELCLLISQKAKDENYEALAVQLRDKLIQAPILKEYPYQEPSDFEEIKTHKPRKRHTFDCNLDKEQLEDKLSGAWIGRISGCLLGKPVEGMKRDKLYIILKDTNNYPMHKYITLGEFTEELKKKIEYEKFEPWQSCWADCIGGIAPIDDDTNYTVFAMKLIETYGKEFRPNDVLEAWLSWIPMFATCTAERVAYRNAAMGLYAPETALLNNPYREWIGAQIRGDFFGYINPGKPEKAAEMAWRDASISHVKNGIYGEMFVAAMISVAAVCNDMMTVIEAGLDEIPKNCRLRRDVERVIDWYRSGITDMEAIENIHKAYDEYDAHDWCHTNSNAMIVVMALLYGDRDFGKSICLAVQSAFDTDCNGATVGSVLGIMIGKEKIPAYWYECYRKKLTTSIAGYNEVTVEQLTEKTMELMKKQ